MKKRKFIKAAQKVITGCLTALVVFNGVVVAPVIAEAADTAETVHYDEEGTYVISDYWSVETKKVPVKAGYVFGGWYTKEGENFVALKAENLSDEAVKGMTDAYPKFVPADVLCVKTQLGQSDTETSLRVLSTVDSKDYQYVGFKIQLGSRTIEDIKMNKVYSGIKKSKTDTKVLKPDETFTAVSEYFIALDITFVNIC